MNATEGVAVEDEAGQGPGASPRPVFNVRRFVARSEHPLARVARRLYLDAQSFTLPAPRVVVRPMLWGFVALRAVAHFGLRVLVCEPLFKASCTRYGRRVRTGTSIHYIVGRGELIVGDDVLVDGKCGIAFAARFEDRPTLTIGDGSVIGHGCRFTVGRRVTIGRGCMIASGVWITDSNGHPSDPAARLAGLPPPDDEVRPVTLGDNVWVGRSCIIFPGVTVGEGSVVAAGSVVMSAVPANTVVAGNPARKVATLKDAADAAPSPR